MKKVLLIALVILSTVFIGCTDNSIEELETKEKNEIKLIENEEIDEEDDSPLEGQG
ncbi:hypothetical protein [Tenacibaculum sp. 190524A02b]|uniref:hypothetical protein n=1 Tax=Tenacibaculum vairaonense TaxID=3137860 RepID=UPI0032B18C62